MDTQNRITEIARGFVGTPYKYGAVESEAPGAFDCSLFTQYVFGQIGIELPRSTIEQASEGEKVSESDLQSGDVIFTRGAYGHYSPLFPEGIGHAGIYTKEGTVIHAASKRINEKPISEKGTVVETSLDEYKEGSSPIVIIRRYIK